MWQTSKDDHPLKQTLSHPQILQPFVILLQFILWLLTMTIPEEGWAHVHTHTHTRRYLHCDDKLVNSVADRYRPQLQFPSQPFVLGEKSAITILNEERWYEMLIQHVRSILCTQGSKVKLSTCYRLLSLSTQWKTLKKKKKTEKLTWRLTEQNFFHFLAGVS